MDCEDSTLAEFQALSGISDDLKHWHQVGREVVHGINAISKLIARAVDDGSRMRICYPPR